MTPRPFRTVYRRTGTSWRWFILSRWDDSEVASGQTLGIADARDAVKKAHAELLASQSAPRSKRQNSPAPRHTEFDVRAGIPPLDFSSDREARRERISEGGYVIAEQQRAEGKDTRRPTDSTNSL